MLLRKGRGASHLRGKHTALVCLQSAGWLLLVGCAVGPDFRSPPPTAPVGWVGPMSPAMGWVTAPATLASGPTTAPASAPASQESVTVPQLAPVVQWWTTFGDPMLDSLINRAVECNLDVRQAQARILQARGQRDIAIADLLPGINATGGYRRSETGTALLGGASSGSGAAASGSAAAAALSNLLGSGTGTGSTSGTGGSTSPGKTNTTSGTTAATTAGPLHSVPHSSWQAGFDATWELDVWGGVRRNVEAATATLQATIEDRRNVLITVMSEVALNYVNLRGFQREIVIARQNLLAQEQTAEVTRKRWRGGFVSRLDVANAEAQVAVTKSVIPTLETQARQSIYNLSVLLGREPGALVMDLAGAAPIPVTPPDVPIGLPSDLLRRRPDIRLAEAQLHAATAQIGVAVSQLFPQFALTGSFGSQSNRLESLFNWDRHIWSFGPTMNWPIFEGGRLRANIRVQTALQEQALIGYERAVLTALQDVENALVAYAREQERRVALDEAVVANRQAVDLSMQLYTQGQTDFLNVLNAQRSLFASEDALIQSERTVATNLIALYKALGGGWEIAPDRTPAPQTMPAPRAIRVLAPMTQPSAAQTVGASAPL